MTKPPHEIDPAAGRNEWEEQQQAKMAEETASAPLPAPAPETPTEVSEPSVKKTKKK